MAAGRQSLSKLGAVGENGERRRRDQVVSKLETAELLPAGSTQRFAPIIGLRNRIVHLYDRVESTWSLRTVYANIDCNWARDNDLLPANCIDWYMAFAFCVWDGGRLPTEAEWEYAAAGYPSGSAHSSGPPNRTAG